MKNKKKIDSKIKTLIIVFLAVILLLFIILGIVSTSKVSSSKENLDNIDNFDQIKSITDFKSIEEILQFSNATLISEEECKENGYTIKIKAKFKYNLFENNESKEKYFLAIINRISYFYRYQKNYILEDNEKNIEIKISHSDRKIKDIIINGLDNFYIIKNNEMKNNLEILSDININSSELKKIINNKCKYDENVFGTKDSLFNEYMLFWDEGIDVKTNNSNIVTNIVFNSRYKEKIINNLNVESSKEQIIKKLGAPAFGNNDYILGYTTEDFYIFFDTIKKEASIYLRYDKKGYEDCTKLILDFLNSKIDIKDFINELTYIWPEYYEYEYSSDYLKIFYPNEGLKIEYGDDLSEGVVLYDNFKNTKELEKWINNGTILYKKNETLYTELENERIEENIIMNNSANLMYEELDIKSFVSDIYKFTYKKNSNDQINRVCFISKDSKYPNKELKDFVNSGFMITNEIFLYSVKNQGIYAYNLVTNEKIKIIEGTEDYNLVKYEKNILYYDESSIELEVS